MGKSLIYKIIVSARPNTWLRVWGEMIVAAILASYPHFDFLSFLKAFIATSPLLWTAAYMLNDLTDTHLDHQHQVRKERPVTLGVMNKKQAIIIIIALTLSSLLLGLTLNYTFSFLLILLAANQLFYTMPGIRLKEKPLFDISVNGVNSVLRYLLGWYSQKAINPFSLPPLLMLLFIKIALFIGHRLQNRQLEKRFGIKSTITILSPKQLYLLIIICIILTVYFYLYSIFVNIFPKTSLLIIPAGIFIYGLLAKKVSFKLFISEERNLNLRNFLYLEYFLITNLIALTIFLR